MRPPPDAAVKTPSTTPRSSADGTSAAPMVIGMPPKRRTNSPCSADVTRIFESFRSSSEASFFLDHADCTG